MTKIYISFLILVLSCSWLHGQYSSFEHEGLTRQYIYYQPSNINANRPLVFVMHGFTGDANNIKNYSQMNQFADQYGFAVCYPRGTNDSNGNRFWNVGYAFHGSETVNDISFLTELAQYLQTTNNLNPDHLFATGMSNGGEMCYMLACQAYDTFKAVAPVAGMILQDILDTCGNSPGIPVFEIHGSQDNVTPLAGDPNNNGGWGAYPSIPFTIDYFVQKNACTSLETSILPDIDTTDGSFVESSKYSDGIGNNEVWYYEVVGGGHDWPGAWGNMDINAGEQAWLFFQNYMDNVLGESDMSSSNYGIQISPNPTNDLITVNSDKPLQFTKVTLYTMHGVSIEVSVDCDQIDLTSLASGTYILRIDTPQGILHKSLIKR